MFSQNPEVLHHFTQSGYSVHLPPVDPLDQHDMQHQGSQVRALVIFRG